MKRSQARHLRALVKAAGLAIEGAPTVTGGGHLKTVVRNPYGIRRFFIVGATPSDYRAQRNNLAKLRRFAAAATDEAASTAF